MTQRDSNSAVYVYCTRKANQGLLFLGTKQPRNSVAIYCTACSLIGFCTNQYDTIMPSKNLGEQHKDPWNHRQRYHKTTIRYSMIKHLFVFLFGVAVSQGSSLRGLHATDLDLPCEVDPSTSVYNLITTNLNSQQVYLSTTPDGRTVDLFSHDDFSGRQKWALDPFEGATDTFHVIIGGGVSGIRTYLSTAPDGRVDLYFEGDNTGRQRWILKEIVEGHYTLTIQGSSPNHR